MDYYLLTDRGGTEGGVGPVTRTSGVLAYCMLAQLGLTLACSKVEGDELPRDRLYGLCENLLGVFPPAFLYHSPVAISYVSVELVQYFNQHCIEFDVTFNLTYEAVSFGLISESSAIVLLF